MLMRRLLEEAGVHGIDIGKPIRVPRHQVVRQGQLEKHVENVGALRPGTRAVMLIIDADDDCPKDLGPQLLERAQRAAGGRLVCSVVLPMRELESWFLATVESLKGRHAIREDVVPPADPENIRDAKGWLTSVMEGRSYVEVDDQPAFAAMFDLQRAHEQCRSFRKFSKDFHEIITTLRPN